MMSIFRQKNMIKSSPKVTSSGGRGVTRQDQKRYPMSKTIKISSESNCANGNTQTNDTTVRLKVNALPSGEYEAVLRTNPEQVVGCIRQDVDIPPSELGTTSLFVVLRPFSFFPGLRAVGSNHGTATINSTTNTVSFTPPPDDDTDEWDMDIYLEDGGTTRVVNRVRIRLTHI